MKKGDGGIRTRGQKNRFICNERGRESQAGKQAAKCSNMKISSNESKGRLQGVREEALPRPPTNAIMVAR